MKLKVMFSVYDFLNEVEEEEEIGSFMIFMLIFILPQEKEKIQERRRYERVICVTF